MLYNRIISLIFISILSIYANQPSSMAVLNFKSTVLDSVEQASLAGYLSTELRRSPNWRVITWEEVARMLENQRARMQLDCDDTRCLDAVAGALNVQYLVAGDISRLGTRWIVNVRLFDTWAAQTKASVSKRTNSIEEILDYIPEIAKELLGEESTPPLANYKLSVSSDAGGDVSITPDKGEYEMGETVLLRANSKRGFSFGGWSGDISGKEPQKSITIDRDMFIKAEFPPIAPVKSSENIRKRKRWVLPAILLSAASGAAIAFLNSNDSESSSYTPVVIEFPGE